VVSTWLRYSTPFLTAGTLLPPLFPERTSNCSHSIVLSVLKPRFRTRQDIVLPLGTPVTSCDGKTDIHEIFLKNNTNVILGLGAANRDPEIWGEDAHVWIPERWIGKTPDQVASTRLPGLYSGM
jgi:hypothetical protein